MAQHSFALKCDDPKRSRHVEYHTVSKRKVYESRVVLEVGNLRFYTERSERLTEDPDTGRGDILYDPSGF